MWFSTWSRAARPLLRGVAVRPGYVLRIAKLCIHTISYDLFRYHNMIFNDTILQSLGIPTDGIEYHGEFPPYNPRLNELARDLRNYGTKSEAMLWKVLKNKQTGYRFTRQKPILNFIADFYCHELHAVVEVDGSSHFSKEDHLDDVERDRQMNAIGIRVVRLLDGDVRRNPIESAQYIFFMLGVEVPEL